MIQQHNGCRSMDAICMCRPREGLVCTRAIPKDASNSNMKGLDSEQGCTLSISRSPGFSSCNCSFE